MTFSPYGYTSQFTLPRIDATQRYVSFLADQSYVVRSKAPTNLHIRPSLGSYDAATTTFSVVRPTSSNQPMYSDIFDYSHVDCTNTVLQQPGLGFNPPQYSLNKDYAQSVPYDGRFHVLTAGFKQTVQTSPTVQAVLQRYSSVDGGSVKSGTVVPPNPGTCSGDDEFSVMNEPAYFAVGGNAGNFWGRFFYGDIAEVIIFNRLLSGDEIALVNDYLKAKHGVA